MPQILPLYLAASHSAGTTSLNCGNPGMRSSREMTNPAVDQVAASDALPCMMSGASPVWDASSTRRRYESQFVVSKNRSEERRVGKECRNGWSPNTLKKRKRKMKIIIRSEL